MLAGALGAADMLGVSTVLIELKQPVPAVLTLDASDQRDVVLFVELLSSPRQPALELEQPGAFSPRHSPDSHVLRVAVELTAITFVQAAHRQAVAMEKSRLCLRGLRVRFSSEPGNRHIVMINDQHLRGFERSDLRFLRLLRLSLERACGGNDGWIDKAMLRSGSNKDREMEKLRRTIRLCPGIALTPLERRSLIETRKGGLVRLAIPPENLEFDPSLANLVLLGTRQKKRTPDQDAGLSDAAQLLKDCQKLWASIPGVERRSSAAV